MDVHKNVYARFNDYLSGSLYGRFFRVGLFHTIFYLENVKRTDEIIPAMEISFKLIKILL